MKYAITFVFESRCGEAPTSDDAVAMGEKFGDWAGLIVHENNHDGQHMGLHARIVSIGIEPERPQTQAEISGMVRRSAAWQHCGPLRLTLGES
jgi:hypothetical protein